MNHSLLAFFSGFPSRRFPGEIGKRLRAELTCRESLVFVSAWPEDFERNDADAAGMHGMFREVQIPFARVRVIDARAEAVRAQTWVREASCVFLMGGHPGLQRRLLCEKGLEDAIRGARGGAGRERGRHQHGQARAGHQGIARAL